MFSKCRPLQGHHRKTVDNLGPKGVYVQGVVENDGRCPSERLHTNCFEGLPHRVSRFRVRRPCEMSGICVRGDVQQAQGHAFLQMGTTKHENMQQRALGFIIPKRQKYAKIRAPKQPKRL